MTNKVNIIQSAQNRFVKHWRKLHKAKKRKEVQSFLIEGEHLLHEVISSNLTILACMVMKEKWSWYRKRFDFGQINAPIYLLPSELFAALMTTQTPQGIAAEVKLPKWERKRRPTGKSTILLLDEIQDPGNLGTMIRTAEATNVDEIWLGKGSVDFTNSKVVRSAMGSLFRVPIFTGELEPIILQLQSEGVQVISTSPRATKNYFQCHYSERVAFLLGNEGRGISESLRKRVDDEVMIPMCGQTESLNVSITASVLLYERLRQLFVTCKDA